jgi:outer membrane protein TolC
MRGFFYALLALWLGLARALTAAEPLDIAEALNRALAQNRSLAQRALALRGAEFALAAARAEFEFSLRPDAAAERAHDGDRYRYGIVVGKKWLPGAEVEAGPRVEWSETEAGSNQRASWRVDVRQPLFRNFGSLIHGESVTQARQRALRARREYELQKADLALRVVDLFESLIRLERQIAADEASLQRLDKLYRLTRARERQGRATRVDTLRVEFQRGEAVSRLETARERLSSQRRDFAELLGEPPDAVFALEPPPPLDLELPPLEEAVRIALENRLDYAQALQDYADAERAERIARRGLLPDLALVARAETFDDAQGDGRENLWSISLAGNTDLNRARERARLGQATITRESAREAVRIRELAIAREVQQTYSAYRRARQELDIAERNYRLAHQRAQLARRLYEIGRGDNFSVTDAEASLERAEDRRLAARADVSGAGYRFLNALGTLIEAPAELRPRVGEIPP